MIFWPFFVILRLFFGYFGPDGLEATPSDSPAAKRTAFPIPENGGFFLLPRGR